MNEFTKTYQMTSQGSSIPRETPSVKEQGIAERIPDWINCRVFKDETPEFLAIARKHLAEHVPAPGTDGHISVYYGRKGNHYFYMDRMGVWTIVGSSNTYDSSAELTTDLRLELDMPSRVKRYHTDK